MDEVLVTPQTTGSNNRPPEPNVNSLKNYVLGNYIAKNILAADLKWSLFCAACNSYRFDSVVEPFPPSFLISEDKKHIDRLRQIIETCPSMTSVLKQLKNNTLPSSLRDLLHWVLIHLKEPNFKYIPKDKHHDIISQVSCKLPVTMPDYIFSVNYGSNQQQKFAFLASNKLLKLAFHGCRLDKFYSILNHGLQISYHKAAEFGPGIYLSSEMVVCLPHSPRGYTWGSSIFGSHISVLALCEVIDHPGIKSDEGLKTKELLEDKSNPPASRKYLIVKNSEFIRVCYLLIYSNDDAENASILQSPTLLGWFKRHQVLAFSAAYIIFLLAVGSINSNILYKYYKKVYKKITTAECNGNFLFRI